MTDEEQRCDWYLPLANGGETGGLNDPGIESFKDPRHLARETVQNIIDAHDPESGGTATVRFDILNMPVSSMPGIETFKRIFAACHQRVRSGGDGGDSPKTKSAKFMLRGSQQLESEAEMPVLRIRDTNTFGLMGSDDDTTSRWYRLVRGQGDAQIEGAGGGTYGIGQRAPFAFTNIRTVFYSTKTREGSSRFMGKFILCSCEHPDERDPETGGPLLTQKIGYYGMLTGNSGSPVSSIVDSSRIPEFFRRSDIGTDVYIMGFTVEDLRTAALRSMLTDFYAAIVHDMIRVVVAHGECETVIDSGNIREMMAQELQHPNLKGGEKRRLQMARNCLEALLADMPITAEVEKLGTVRLYVHRADESSGRPSNKVSYMRTPRMRVQSKSCNKLRGYDAVLLVDEPEGNNYLAALENPEHDRWHHTEASHWSEEARAEAQRVLSALYEFIRSSLDRIRGESGTEAEDIPELSRFLPSEDDDYGMEVSGGDESERHVDEETPREVPKPIPVKVVVAPPPKKTEADQPEAGDGLGDGDGQTGTGHEDGTRGKEGRRDGDEVGDGSGERGGEEEGGRILTRRDIGFRSWRPSASAPGVYRIRLSPKTTVNGAIQLRARGETGLQGVRVLGASDLDAGGRSLAVTAGQLDPFEFQQGVARNIEVLIDGDVDVALTMEAR